MTGLLRTLARHAAYGLTQALHGPPPAEHGPLPPEYCDAPDDHVWETGSAPPMRGDTFSAPSCMAGTTASAGQWAIAISAAGKQLSDEGFEDQAVMCFVAAGELDAIAHGDIAR